MICKGRFSQEQIIVILRERAAGSGHGDGGGMARGRDIVGYETLAALAQTFIGHQPVMSATRLIF